MSIRYYFPGLLFEVTARTIAGAFLFDPVTHPGFRDAFNAIIAIAQQKHGIHIYAFFAVSNHYHAIFGAKDADSLADFLCDVHGNMARYANGLLGRTGPVFSGRCDVTPIIPSDKCLSERVCYIMGQAIKVDAQWTLENWPGANTNRALMYGEPMIGKHFDRHQRTLDARLKGGPKADDAYTTEHTVTVSPLPGWETLPVAELRAKYRAIGDEAWLRYKATACAKGGIVQTADNAGEFSIDKSEFQGAPRDQQAPRLGFQSLAQADAFVQGAATGQPPVAGTRPSEHAPPCCAAAAPPKRRLTDAQKAWMQMPRPRPKQREQKRARRPEAYADTEAQITRYREAYKAVREAHVKARRELEEQSERALRGLHAKAVLFPLYTFAAVARTGRLALEMGKSAALGEAA